MFRIIDVYIESRGLGYFILITLLGSLETECLDERDIQIRIY